MYIKIQIFIFENTESGFSIRNAHVAACCCIYTAQYPDCRILPEFGYSLQICMKLCMKVQFELETLKSTINKLLQHLHHTASQLHQNLIFCTAQNSLFLVTQIIFLSSLILSISVFLFIGINQVTQVQMISGLWSQKSRPSEGIHAAKLWISSAAFGENTGYESY